MIKLFKFVIKISVLLVVVAAGFMAYRLWDQGELKKENFNREAMGELFSKEAQRLGSEVKEGSLALKDKIQNEWIDWDELKGNWTLSEDEFEAFKRESLAFLSIEGEDGSSEPEEEPSVRVEKTGTETAKVEDKTQPEPPPVKKEVVVKKEPARPAPRAPSSPYPNLEKSRSYAQAMTDLENAKNYNRKGLPGKPNAKSNLKKAVSFYKKSQKQMAAASRTSGLTNKEKAHIEKLQEEIGKQIYWGSKLGSL
jgi:hypothetical protein